MLQCPDSRLEGHPDAKIESRGNRHTSSQDAEIMSKHRAEDAIVARARVTNVDPAEAEGYGEPDKTVDHIDYTFEWVLGAGSGIIQVRSWSWIPLQAWEALLEGGGLEVEHQDEPHLALRLESNGAHVSFICPKTQDGNLAITTTLPVSLLRQAFASPEWREQDAPHMWEEHQSQGRAFRD